MKIRISKADYEALSPEVQALYEVNGDGYRVILDDHDHDEAERLRTSNRTLLDQKKKAEQETAETRRLADEAKAANGDFESLYKSSEAKRKQLEDAQTERDEVDRKSQIKNAALELAGTMATGKDIALLARFIRERLDFVDGKIIVTQGGKPTVSSVDDLKAEMIKSEDFDSLLDADIGSGGDSRKKKSGNKGEKWSDFTPTELSAIKKEDQGRYDRLKETR